MNFPRVYPITDTRISGLSHAEQVKLLLKGGAEIIQIREKWLSPRRFYEEALAALRIAKPLGAKIIINDRVDIALALKADGIHLGQSDLPPGKARLLLGPEAIIGYSTHNKAQAAKASALPIDYLAIGPVFPTKTKDDPDPITGLGEISEISKVIRGIPIIAIGGINLDNIGQAFSAGAQSCAVINSIISAGGDIESRMSEMLEKAAA